MSIAQTPIVLRVKSLFFSQFFMNVSQTFLTRILLIFFGLITSVLISRTLGPEARGYYALAMLIGSVGIQFGNFGLHASNTYYVSRNKELLSPIISNSLFASIFLSAVVVVVLSITFYFFPKTAPLKGSLLLMSFIMIPLGLSYLLLQNILLATHQITQYNIIEIISKVLNLLLVVLLVTAGLLQVNILFAVTLFITFISFSLVLLRLNKLTVLKFHFSWSLFKDTFLYGIRAYFSSLFAFLVIRIDMLMVQQYLGAEKVGYYSTATTFIDMLYILPTVIGTLIFPKLSGLDDEHRKRKLTVKTAILSAVVMLFISIFFYFIFDYVVVLLYGKAFLPASDPFRWLLPGVIFLSANTVLMNYFASSGMPVITIISPGIALAINIIINTYFIPKFGLVGASFSSSIAYFLMLLFSILYISFKKTNNERL